MSAAEKLNPTIPIAGDDPVSRSLNEFYHAIAPENKDPYVGLKMHLIRPDVIPAVSFFIKRGKRFRLFRFRQETFQAFEMQSLLDAGIDKIFIERKDIQPMRAYLETFLTSIGSKDVIITTEAQVGLMRSSAVRITQEILKIYARG